MATLESVQGVMLQMQREDSTYLTWGAPGCAVLPDGTFFVIAHTEFDAGYTSGNSTPRGYDGGYYGYQTWRLDADLNVTDYQLYDQLTSWSPLYVVPLEDYVVQVHFSDGLYFGADPRTVLFDCRDGGAAIMTNVPDPSGPDMGGGTYSFLYTAHLYLREFGIVALATITGIHTYRRGQLLASATYEELGMPRFVSVVGMHPHPTDSNTFAIVDWGNGNLMTTYEVTVNPSSGAFTTSELWQRDWATDPSDYVLAVANPYAEKVWGWVSDDVPVPGTFTSYSRYFLRDMAGGEGVSVWDRLSDAVSNNNVTRTITPNLMVAAVEMYDTSATTLAPGVPNYAEEFWIAACVIDTGHGDPTARMIGLSRRDLVLGPDAPYNGYEDITDVRNGSQYAPAYRDGTLLMASCPVYRAADNIDRFPVLVWKLEGVGHAEFGVANDLVEWLPLADGIGPGRLKVRTDDGWHESVTVATWDQEWKPLKINTAEEGQQPVWRTVALLTPSLD